MRFVRHDRHAVMAFGGTLEPLEPLESLEPLKRAMPSRHMASSAVSRFRA
jgi:hypothetical protein